MTTAELLNLLLVNCWEIRAGTKQAIKQLASFVSQEICLLNDIGQYTVPSYILRQFRNKIIYLCKLTEQYVIEKRVKNDIFCELLKILSMVSIDSQNKHVLGNFTTFLISWALVNSLVHTPRVHKVIGPAYQITQSIYYRKCSKIKLLKAVLSLFETSCRVFYPRRSMFRLACLCFIEKRNTIIKYSQNLIISNYLGAD